MEAILIKPRHYAFGVNYIFIGEANEPTFRSHLPM